MADTLYDVLEVSRTASSEMIKKAYRIQLTMHHPDRGGDPDMAQTITAAYAVLSDPEARRTYDADLELEADRQSGTSSVRSGDVGEPVADWGEEVRAAEPTVDWGAEMPVEEPAHQAMPTFAQDASAQPAHPFPWEAGGTWPESEPAATPQAVTRPVVNWIAGALLLLASGVPVIFAVLARSDIFGNVFCSGAGLAIGWVAGRRRAAGGPLGAGYVIFVMMLVATTALGLAMLGGNWPIQTMALPIVWVTSYVVFVESSCIWRRKTYWAQA